MTQTNLGGALMMLGERESSTARLEEAIAAYRDALRERTRERVPLDWAMTQRNLGGALARLSAREAGTARLELAVKALQDALQIFEIAGASYYAQAIRKDIALPEELLTERRI